MMETYTTLEDIQILFRKLNQNEEEKAERLIQTVEDTLRQEAVRVGKDLDEMVEDGELLQTVLVQTVVDIIGRALNASTTAEAVSQYSQSALGYSVSGTYLNPGGGIYIKRDELKRLGLRKQRYGVISFA